VFKELYFYFGSTFSGKNGNTIICYSKSFLEIFNEKYVYFRHFPLSWVSGFQGRTEKSETSKREEIKVFESKGPQYVISNNNAPVQMCYGWKCTAFGNLFIYLYRNHHQKCHAP
jgi:hypothetical protein